MGKKLVFRKKSYIYLTPTEEETIDLVIAYLKTCTKNMCGIGELRRSCQKIYKARYGKPLSNERINTAIWQLMSVHKIKAEGQSEVLQIWEVKRKRNVRLLC